MKTGNFDGSTHFILSLMLTSIWGKYQVLCFVSGKVKHELPVASGKFKSTSYELKSTSYEFKSTNYKFIFMSYEFKSTSQETQKILTPFTLC